MGYYVIKYLSEPYTLQYKQTTYGQLNKAGELVVKAKNLRIMKTKTNWYWKQYEKKQSVIT